MAIKYENISATKHIVRDKVNLPLNNSLIFILKIQLSPKSPLKTILETHLPYLYKKGLSKPKRIFSFSISSYVICDPWVFLNARYLSAQVPGTNSINEKTIKHTSNKVITASPALVRVNCIKLIIFNN